MTVSYWRRSRSARRIEREVVVIGGGICGVSAALHVQDRGVGCAVVERHTVGSGASQRNAGFLMRGAADNYAAAVREYGRDRAGLLWRWTEENLAGLRARGIDRLESYRAVPSCLLALDEKESAELRSSRAMLDEDGFEVGWLEGGGAGTDAIWSPDGPGPKCGLLNPGDAAVNPHELMGFLASRLDEPVLENQEVFGLVERSGRIEVHLADAVIRCRRVLVCTNAYGPGLVPGLAPLITARRGQMIAVSAPGVRLDFSYYANHGSEYFRQTPEGTIVVGGCRTYHADREVGYDDTVTDWVQGDIEAFARRVLGPRFTVLARWGGIMGFSADGLPLIGPVAPGPGEQWGEEGVWFCGAFTGHGMSMAHRAALCAVAAMLAGEENPFPIMRFGVAGRPASGVATPAGRVA